MEKYDFSGWATRTDRLCSDGRIIKRDAFKHNDGKTVPLVWNHRHDDPNEVLGHALLENREDGVYAYCKFNDTESGSTAKMLVKHGDIDSLSIYANQLKHQQANVIHGNIREVSLVLAGANPGAYIDSVMIHGEESDEEAIIYSGEEGIELEHGDEEHHHEEECISHADEEDDNMPKEKTIGDVFETLNEEQKKAVYALIGYTMSENNPKEADNVKHNVFDNEERYTGNTLSHSDMQEIISDAKRYGSMKDSFLAHTEQYGIQDIDWLFPEPKNLNTPPEFISRDMGWVSKVMHGVAHTPFSRIKSMFADIREDEARAKGYIKGKRKKEEVFTLLKRSTSPTTIYKKQKMDRDDVIDITDFDVIAWLKGEMRLMLDEEIARAILIGDGRLSDSDDKIKEDCIRPISKDDELFTIRTAVNVSATANSDEKAKAFIRAAIKARKDYKGSGEPTLYTTEDILSDCLLLEDGIGHLLYKSVSELATTLRVKEIVIVPVMEGVTGPTDSPLMGLIVNLKDYKVGADKGGAINMFDDFDIDYNQQKYLIETRCSGALVKPYSAIALEMKTAG